MRRDGNGDLQAVVAPITHSPPNNRNDSIEIPASICRSLGLDDGPHWLRCDELNRFVWPGYDLRARPDKPGTYDYGLLPQALFEQLRTAIVKRQRERAGKMISR